MATVSYTAYNTADTAVAGATMNTLTSGSFALGSAIDNSSSKYLWGDLELVLSSSVTAGSGNPTVDVYLLPAVDGTNYPTPPGGSGAAAPATYLVGSIVANASAGITVGHLLRIPLVPQNFKIMIKNVLGASFPATNTSTLKLYRYGLTVA